MEDNRFSQLQQPTVDLAQSRQQSFEPNSIDYMATEIKNKAANKNKQSREGLLVVKSCLL